MVKKTGFIIALSFIVSVFMFSSLVLADAGHEDIPDSHGMVTQTTDRSSQLPNVVGGFVVGVAVGIILTRFIFKKS